MYVKPHVESVKPAEATAIPPLDENYTAWLQQQFGEPDVVYDYKDIGRQLQYQILRWNATAARDKIVRPDRKGLTKDNRIPYCLDRLLSAAGIAIHEGEKATDAFNRDYDAFMAYSPEYVRWVGVTAGACSYAEVFRRALSNPENHFAFWNCFTEKPKPVLIFTDNDEAGHKGAFDVRDVFRKFGFEPLIYSLPFCGGAAEDYADFAANHFTDDGVGQPIEALFELSILTNEGGKF